jgi:hypothetical protein
MFVGLMSDRGRGSIGSYVGNVVYSIVAMGMLATVSNAPDSQWLRQYCCPLLCSAASVIPQ